MGQMHFRSHVVVQKLVYLSNNVIALKTEPINTKVSL